MSVKTIVKKLSKQKKSLAVAESITAGGLAAAITEISGASKVFLGGVIVYSDEAKIKQLGVSRKLIAEYTAVSEQVVIEMANSVRKKFGADYAIATTGVAGPKAAYGQKPGTVWLAIADGKSTLTIPLSLTDDRDSVRNAAIESAIATFSRILSS
jgi:PncC family amidohydrolase